MLYNSSNFIMGMCAYMVILYPIPKYKYSQLTFPIALKNKKTQILI